ncbi:MAG: DNA polymerase IV [Actinomycetota bacterium]|nr:DNA polymerase IV [Actinomycetota bacterium]
MFVSRSILHADVDAFFAAVEQRDRPELRGRPVLVGRGVVLAASYEAKARGVRSGMGGGKARRLCPGAIVVPARFDAYVAASKGVFAAFRSCEADVEGRSMEEAFLYLRGGADTAEVGARVRARVRAEAGLTVTVGGGSTRMVAKMAGRTAKPDGLRVIAPADELAFLHGLAVEDIWGIGEATARKLHARGLRMVADLAALDEPVLMMILGKASGRALHAMAHNRELPVRRRRGRRSVGSQSALRRRGWSSDLDDVLARLADRVTGRMAKAGLTGRTVVLRLRFGDYSRVARSRTLPHPTADPRDVLVAARGLLWQARPAIERRAVTLLGLAVTNLGAPHMGEQLALFAADDRGAAQSSFS